MFTRARLIPGLGAALALCFVAPSLSARQQPAQSAQQPPPYEPKVGMPGKDAVWVPTHPAVLEKMLDVAKVTANDVVVDLGSGDGRTVIAAAKRGAKAIGFEYNAELVELSRKLAKEAGVADKASFVQGDMYQAEFPDATVLALFLLPTNLEKLQDKILALKPGTRLVLNTFRISGWEPDERVYVGGDCASWCDVLLHIVPAKVAGTWRGEGIQLDLSQAYQKVLGTVTASGATTTIESGGLRGDQLTFSAGGTSYTARVDGDRMIGTTAAPTGPKSWTVARDRK
jgi:SAM-dependent methyltransferase